MYVAITDQFELEWTHAEFALVNMQIKILPVCVYVFMFINL